MCLWQVQFGWVHLNIDIDGDSDSNNFELELPPQQISPVLSQRHTYIRIQLQQ